ncbi:GNAT family N-acetyltransferase [Pseudenhygromyxa sp. WMMC2535]|uniref:GNAT family N-acetyltransferase n=1 Tax=Pseudenhygromyxa sp. WMMC2535 TaxID=2712867 RepID=UPI00155582F8|nr:GNAT family N-acetyltransferase [Pseudenhygromyxa sp. WMMC2535]NVB36541.1 GNAT family N-acetyltransferase [Pseudenhygromyxa sp. WMMC2535]
MIETKRLRCEPVEEHHAESMFSVLSDPRIYTYLPGKPPASLEDLRRRYAFLSGGRSPDGSEYWLNWILFLRETDTAIGFWQATVRPDGRSSIAFVLDPTHWGQGLAHEASVALIGHLFARFEIDALGAEVHFDNHRSAALVGRLGFRVVGQDLDEQDNLYELRRTDWSVDA